MQCLRKKYANLFFVLCWSNMNQFQLVGLSWKKHLKRKNCSLHVKYVLTLPWEIWGDRLSRQLSTYTYILMNHWIATKRLAVIMSKIVKHIVIHIMFRSYAQNVCLQHVDAGTTSPTAHSMYSVIQTVHLILMWSWHLRY